MRTPLHSVSPLAFARGRLREQPFWGVGSGSSSGLFHPHFLPQHKCQHGEREIMSSYSHETVLTLWTSLQGLGDAPPGFHGLYSENRDTMLLWFLLTTKDNVSRKRCCAFTLLRVSKEPVRHNWKSWADRDNLRFTVITLLLTSVWVTLGKSNYFLCVLVSTSIKWNIVCYKEISGLTRSSESMVWCYRSVCHI